MCAADFIEDTQQKINNLLLAIYLKIVVFAIIVKFRSPVNIAARLNISRIYRQDCSTSPLVTRPAPCQALDTPISPTSTQPWLAASNRRTERW